MDGTAPALRVRPLDPADATAVKRLHKFAKLQGQPVFGLDQRGVEAMIESAANLQDGAFGFVGVEQDEGEEDVVAAATAQQEAGGGLVVLSVVVRSDARGKGVGKRLLASLLEQAANQHAGSVLTDVAAANGPAMSFFKRAGFKQVHSDGKTVELARSLAVRASRLGRAGGSAPAATALARRAPQACMHASGRRAFGACSAGRTSNHSSASACWGMFGGRLHGCTPAGPRFAVHVTPPRPCATVRWTGSSHAARVLVGM